MRLGGKIKQALELTLLLASIEFISLSVILQTVAIGTVVLGGDAHQNILPANILSHSFFTLFYKAIWAGYPTIATLFYISSYRVTTDHFDITRLLSVSIIGYIVFCVGYFYIFNHDSLDSLLNFPKAQPFWLTNYFVAVGITSLVAPMLITRLSLDVRWNLLSRIKRALLLVVLLVVTDYILLTILSVGIEIAHLAFYGSSSSGVLAAMGLAGTVAGMLGLLAIVIFFGIILQGYTITALIIVLLDFIITKHRYASLAKLLIASLGAYALCVGSIILQEDVGLYPQFLSFEFTTPWSGNFLYTLGMTVILAPAVIFYLARRIRWLSGLLHGS